MTAAAEPTPRRAKLTPARIVEAALALIDAEGLEQLSMRKLGAALSVEAMSLYNHVPSKDVLLRRVQEALASTVRAEGPVVGWKGLLGALARAAHRVLNDHPKAAPLFSGASFEKLVSPEDWDKVLRRMREVGFPEPLRQQALDTVNSYVMGSCLRPDLSARAFEDGLELVLEGVESARRRARN
jgi:TetR/AcrR family transcriptional regulator, tetracycline repressor protein